jgi:hypothetical protein
MPRIRAIAEAVPTSNPIRRTAKVNPRHPASKLYTSADGGSVRLTWSPVNQTWFLLWPGDVPVEKQQVLSQFPQWEEGDREARRITSRDAPSSLAVSRLRENPIITAKYPGWCPKCGQKISVGSKILWNRGEKPVHATCPSGASRPSPQGQATPHTQTAPEPGAIDIRAIRRGRADRHFQAGSTIYGPKIQQPGGGPDGHYYTVISSTLYPPEEDIGEHDWVERAWVRPATDAEAAPLHEKMSKQSALEGLVSELLSIVRAGESLGDVAQPAGRVYTIHPGVGGSGKELLIWAYDGAVYLWKSGHHDDYIRSCWVTHSERAAEIMRLITSQENPREDLRTIVIAWTEDESEAYGPEARVDLGHRRAVRSVRTPYAALWKASGSTADVEKAQAYADVNNANAGNVKYFVLAYPTTDQSWKEHAKRDVLKKAAG